MDSDQNPTTNPSSENPKQQITLKIFGVGNAGIAIIEQLIAGGLPASIFVAINADGHALDTSSAAGKVQLENRLLRGLGSGGDPDRGRALAEEHISRLKALCEGTDVVFIVAGLGGGAGAGISPVLARTAREQGALALAFTALPFECEGTRRQHFAQQALEELKEAADGVICLPNQKVFKLIDENTSVLETFKITNELLADGVRGLWRLLTHRGLIEIHFENVCELVRDRHAESAFAVAESIGPTRSREVIDKLLAHPLLDGGDVLGRSEAVLVSLIGGPDLTMAEVNRVVEAIKAKCQRAQLIVGAALDESFRERLAVTLIAAREITERSNAETRLRGEVEPLDAQLLNRGATEQSCSRFVPPAPVLPPEQVQQMLARQGRGNGRARKLSSKMRQGQLPLEIISKGRFDKSEPTIHKGEDLDVPTYIRRGVSLN
jgi:cell division protein FtsZ